MAPSDDDAANDDAADVAIVELAPIPDVAADGVHAGGQHGVDADATDEKAEDPEGSGAKSTMVGALAPQPHDAAATDGALTGALVPPHDAAASPDKEKAEESAAAATDSTDVAKNTGALQGDAAAATDVTAENTPKGSGTKSNTDGALVPPPHDAAASPDKEKAEESAAAATDGTDVAKDAGALPPPHDAVASPDDEAEESVPSARTRYSDSSDDSINNVIDNRGIPTAINAIQDQILSPMGSPSKKQTCIVKAKSIPVHPVVLGLMLPRLLDGRIVSINTNHNDPKANLIGEITNRLLGNPTNACIENHKNGDITADQLIAHAFIGEKDALTTEVSVQQVNTK